MQSETNEGMKNKDKQISEYIGKVSYNEKDRTINSDTICIPIFDISVGRYITTCINSRLQTNKQVEEIVEAVKENAITVWVHCEEHFYSIDEIKEILTKLFQK